MDFNKVLRAEFNCIFDINKNINGMILKKWLNNNDKFKIYFNNLLKAYPNFGSIGNLIYCFRHDFDIDLYICKTCGKKMCLKSATQMKCYCSKKCAMTNKELQLKRKKTISENNNYYLNRQEKIKNTNLERYGAEYPAQSTIIKEKIKSVFANNNDIWKDRNAKSINTIQTKYGKSFTNISQVVEVKEKVKKTCLKRYGGVSPIFSNNVKNKIKETCLKKYGVDNPLKLKHTTKLQNSYKNILTWNDYVKPVFSIDDWTGYSNAKVYEWECAKCKRTFLSHIYHTKHISRTQYSQLIPRCLNCYPLSKSSGEKELIDFCKQYYPNLLTNDRTLIKPLELDIIIPELKLAIEFNGDYWHSNEFKNRNYHLNKTIECEKIGYRLIHIFEHEWLFKQELIKSKLKSIFNVEQESIYARKCIIKEISVKEKNKFLNENHIQGEDKSNIKLGLYFNDVLVSVMTFCHSRFNKGYEWELSRYAGISKKRILGGAGKLLRYFERTYKPKSLITYADRRFSQGNLYYKLGFNKLNESLPGYVYVKDGLVIKRYKAQKHKLKQLLGENRFNENLSETENMLNNNFCKIYDCGNLVFYKQYWL